jgi:hypothetical protein
MSTTGRADTVPQRAAPADAGLTPRALRVRNACVQHAAARLGLPVPDRDDLAALDSDASLARSVEWWRARTVRDQPTVQEPALLPPRRSTRALRTAWVSAAVVLALALSYGTAQ